MMQSKLLRMSMAGVVVLAGTMFFASSGVTWEQGRVKINPAFKVEEQWDSNIFYDRTNEKGSMITLLTPGVAAEFGFGAASKHKATIDYGVEIGMFGSYDKQNYGNHNLDTALSFDLNKYTWDLSNNFQFTSSRAGTEFTTRNLRKIDTVKSVAGAHYNKLDFESGYSFYIVNYLSDTLKTINRYENDNWLTGYIQAMPKTKVLGEVGYKYITYPDTSNRNANDFRFLTGVKGEITSKIDGTIKAGYKVKTYRTNSRNDFYGIVTQIALNYDISDRANLTFVYDREPYESVYNNSNYYTGDHFLSTLNYQLGDNWLAKIDGMYYHNDYPSPGAGEDKKRKDNEWELGGKLDYIIKEWATAGVGYKFHQRESNIGDRRYDQHVISADVALKF